jgi:hypothetical protein
MIASNFSRLACTSCRTPSVTIQIVGSPRSLFEIVDNILFCAPEFIQRLDFTDHRTVDISDVDLHAAVHILNLEVRPRSVPFEVSVGLRQTV